MTDSSPGADTPAPVDLSTCDREPIHIPGCIQPHGVLLAAGAGDLLLRATSANAPALLGPEAAPGRPLLDLLTPASAARVQEALEPPEAADPQPLSLALSGMGRAEPWDGQIHRSGDLILLELEPGSPAGPGGTRLMAAVRAALGRLEEIAALPAFCDAAAREVRGLTGYDRVMVYQFDPDWNGAVVAEDRRDDLAPYLGLHYPASDIPAQARALYRLNPLRLIPDVQDRPCPLVPAVDPVSGQPIDLSRALLRGVSPVHLEYLRNMGVRASLSLSLLREGALWGLIACHHMTPKPLPADVREACALLGQVVSAQLTSKAEAQDAAERRDRAATLDRLRDRVAADRSLSVALTEDEADLLGLMDAAGAALWRGGEALLLGHTPPAAAVQALVEWLKASAGGPVFATDRLAAVCPRAAPFADVASGLLALELAQAPDFFVLWFRPDVVQTVDWAGDPRKAAEPAGPDGRLHPRRSFALWQETVRGRSRPWRTADVDRAGQLLHAIRLRQARTAERLRTMMPICAWCKKVRNDRDYWQQVEEYVGTHTDLRFTHGICPDCFGQELEKVQAAQAERKRPG